MSIHNKAPEAEELRRTRLILWCEVVNSVAGASNASNPESMSKWADYAVNEFDRRIQDGEL